VYRYSNVAVNLPSAVRSAGEASTLTGSMAPKTGRVGNSGHRPEPGFFACHEFNLKKNQFV
jgi:hypothetical protein